MFRKIQKNCDFSNIALCTRIATVGFQISFLESSEDIVARLFSTRDNFTILESTPSCYQFVPSEQSNTIVNINSYIQEQGLVSDCIVFTSLSSSDKQMTEASFKRDVKEHQDLLTGLTKIAFENSDLGDLPTKKSLIGFSPKELQNFILGTGKYMPIPLR